MTFLISHIPKTAGTSLKSLVSKHNPDSVLIYGNELSIGNPNIEFISKFRAKASPSLVMGHFSYGAHRLLGTQPKYITMLRDPIERVISLYYFLKNVENIPFNTIFNQNISLENFASKEDSEQVNNHMCRIISGVPPEMGMNLNEKWLLNLAIHNLHTHFVLIGTVDESDRFINALSKLLNWPDSKLPKNNMTPNKDMRISSNAVEIIKKRNSLDIQLYEYVKQLERK